MPRTLLLVVLVVVIAFAGRGRTQTPAASQHVFTLLDRYAQGDYAAADHSQLNPVAWVAFASSLESAAPVWIRQAAEADVARRRRIAAAYLLETANAALESPSRLLARRLLAAVCADMRRGPADEYARAWWRASVVVLERAEDWDVLLGTGAAGELKDGHLAHAREALGEDEHLRLAGAIGEEGRSWGGAPANLQRLVRRLPATRNVDLGPVAERFAALTSAAEVGSEAALRLAMTNLRRGQIDATAFSVRATAARDPFVGYVSRLVSGAILLQQRRPTDAMTNFREALVLAPRAQSAGTMLVSALTSAGQLDEARDVTERLVTSQPGVDPWRQYRIGSGRRWPQTLRDLRERLK